MVEITLRNKIARCQQRTSLSKELNIRLEPSPVLAAHVVAYKLIIHHARFSREKIAEIINKPGH